MPRPALARRIDPGAGAGGWSGYVRPVAEADELAVYVRVQGDTRFSPLAPPRSLAEP